MNKPDPDQLEVINATASPILAVASPGAGKTATLIWRIQRLIKDGVAPGEMVVISYTNAAAKEVQSRIGEDVRLGYIGTLHSFMFHMLQSMGHLIGFHGKISVLDEDGAVSFFQDCMARSNYKGKMEDLLKAIAKGPGKPSKSMNRCEILVHDFYQSLLTSNMVTFDSILIMGNQLLDALPIQRLTCNGKDHLNFLFVDETQDCSSSDAEIFDKLPIQNKFFIGDPDQNIFSFRGANLGFILDLSRRSTVFKLQTNYRSDLSICTAAQRLIELNQNRIPKKTVSHTQEPGSVEVAGPFDNPILEYNFLAKQIVELPVEPSDCAILVRTNALVQEISNFLKSLSITVSERKESLPADWGKCRHLISLLTNPQNDFLAEKWLIGKVGKEEAGKIALNASRNYQSINDFYLHIPPIEDLKELPDLLLKGGFTTETIALISKTVDSLVPGSGLPDLTIALGREISSRMDVGKGIVVKTLHGAKGNEFHTVFLPAFEDEVIPGKRKSADIEEERHLAYVGITRAKHRVVFSYCKARKSEWEWSPQPVNPSRFLNESLF